MIKLDSIKIKDSSDTYNTLLDAIYPVGSVFFSWNDINPCDVLGGTWIKYGGGVIASAGSLGTTGVSYVAVGESGGSYYVHTENIPPHYHTISLNTGSSGKHNHGAHLTSDHRITEVSSGSTYYVRYNTADNNWAYVTEAGAHSHTVSGNTGNTGGGKAFTPYHHSFAVWKRTN